MWGTDVTFTFGKTNRDINSTSAVTKGDVTVTVAQNGAAKAPNFSSDASDVRFQAGNKMTISSDASIITQVVLTYTMSSYAEKITQSSFNSGTYSYTKNNTTGTWNGSSNDLTIENKAASQTRISQIVVTYIPATVDLTDDEFSWSAGTYTATIDASNSFPSLTNTKSVSVTYQSTNTSAATINSSTGAISLVAAGETTIKAVFAGNGTYNAKTVSYDLTVLAAGAVAAPTFNKDDEASVELGTIVTITAPDEECTLKYQIGDGEVVNVNTYTANVTMNTIGSVTLKAWTVKNATDSDPAQISLTVTKHPISLSFSPDAVSVVRGENVTAPTLNGNTGSGTVTYSSADETVATVNALTGAVTGVKVGSTTITATVAATSEYLGNTATFTVTVTKPYHTVTFSVNGNTSRTASVQEDVAITFPTAVETTPGDGEFPKVINGKTFVGWYTAEYAHATDAPIYVNSANMGNADITYYAVYADVDAGDPTVVTLSNNTIKNNVTGKSSYSDSYNIENWTGRYLINNTSSVYSLQLGYNTDSSKSAYNSHLTTPNCADNIQSITIETQNSTASGRKFFLCSADNLGTASNENATYGSGSLSAANGSVTINVTGNTKQLHIYPDGIAYIKTISLTSQSVLISDYTTDARSEAGISFANASVDAQLTSGYTGQALTNTNSVSPITYSSSDEAVATINSSTGAITELLKAGTTTITATFAGNATYKPAEVSYDLNVTEKTPHGLAYATDVVEKLTTDAAFTNTLTNAHSLTVSYSSSATGVATVNSSTGEVTIKGAGSATITATFAGNEDYEAGDASYTLTVSKATPTLSFASANATLRQGKDFEGNALTNPAGLTVSYSSSTTSVATVNSSTGVPAFVAAGSTTITASFAGNDTYTSAEATYTLKVLAAPTISLSDDNVDWGDTYTFDASGLSSYGDVTLTSGNTSIATIDGLVITPVACGTVTITVSTAENETYDAGSATFDLTIIAPAGSTTAPSSEVTTTFTDKDLNHNVGGLAWTASIAANSFESGGSKRCVQFGAAKGEFTLNLANTKKVKKVSFVMSTNGTGNTIAVQVGSTDFESSEATSVTLTSGMSNGNLEFTGEATIGNIVVSCNDKDKSIYFKSITVEYDDAETVTLNASGYATFCSQYPLDFSAATGYTAWQVTGTRGTAITFEKITGSVKGGTGILLKGEANAPITLTFADSDNTLGSNMLVGTTAPTYVTTVNGDYTNFGLSGETFKKINTGTVKVGKAYLPILTANVPKAADARLTFVFEDSETTGISDASRLKDNGGMKNDNFFNLKGQRIAQPTKGGLYIVNGKKVVIK